MGYAATTGAIIYWNREKRFIVNKSHHVWFYEYISFLSIEDKHTIVYLLLQQYPGIILHHSYLLNLIPFKLDLTSIPFHDTTILTYDIKSPSAGNKLVLIYWKMNILQARM